MEQLSWKTVVEAVFAELDRLIEAGEIKTGPDERRYLLVESNRAVAALLVAHGLRVQPNIKTKTNQRHPNQITLVLDELTKAALRDRGLL